ncbi:MAG: NAD(+) diphosphatase [Spirochaetia bacterium]|nr:NAD(+) diphosphatase [Spirochaetia bacterium]
MEFVPGVFCDNTEQRGFWFLFKKGKVLYFGSGDSIRFPELLRPSELGLKTTEPVYIGQLNGKNVFTAQVFETEEPYHNCCGVANYPYALPRDLFMAVGEDMFNLICRAWHISRWTESWKFCPSCGAPMRPSGTERAKVCTSCGRTDYPLLSPAVIVAVTKGDRLLLASNSNFPAGRYSILAGFVESGESAEDTIHREIMEEVGIKVKNIKYFGSQCWPFPNSFMLGFTAEWESGELHPDGVEIIKADWFKADSMPDIPPCGSISRKLINNFIKTKGNCNDK